MKKLTTFIAVISVALFMSSCLKSSDYKELEVQPGIDIYNATLATRIVTKDPIYVAFKLNTLLATVAAQNAASPITPVTIENVMVTVKVGDKEVKKSLKNLLFSGNAIEESETTPGNWKITFNSDYVAESDSRRSGVMEFITGGKLLGELETGNENEQWLVKSGSSSEAYKMYDGYYVINCVIPYCAIMQIGTNNWAISVESNAYIADYRDFPAEWSSYFELRQSGAMLQTYDNVIESNFIFGTISVASGRLMGNKDIVSYEASGLTYKPSCGRAIYKGTEIITVESELDPKRYPSKTATYSWREGATSCTYYWNVKYNGFEYDSGVAQ